MIKKYTEQFNLCSTLKNIHLTLFDFFIIGSLYFALSRHELHTDIPIRNYLVRVWVCIGSNYSLAYHRRRLICRAKRGKSRPFPVQNPLSIIKGTKKWKIAPALSAF